MSRIVWLASYPKSGNTWVRVFLSNFERDSDAPADIDSLNGWGISSDRSAADHALGVECSDLTHEEIERWRPAVFRNIAECSRETVYMKTHDAYTLNSRGEPLFPSDVTKGTLYLVRNPLDVAVSYAHHEGITLDECIDRMSRDTLALAGRVDRLSHQLRQRVSSWSGHVLSWVDQCAIALLVMRYEDMCLQPVEEFARAIRFLGLEDDDRRVRRAAEFSSYEILRRQELEHGFKEKPPKSASFFRRGRVGGWREVLTEQQVERVVRDHGVVMDRLGYLPEGRCTERPYGNNSDATA